MDANLEDNCEADVESIGDADFLPTESIEEIDVIINVRSDASILAERACA